MPGQPERQGNHRDRHGGNDAAFVKPGVVVHQQLQFAIATTRGQCLDRAPDHDHADRQHHRQRHTLEPQPGAQRQWQERGEQQRLPHPRPLIERVVGKIGGLRGQPAIDQQHHQQRLPQRQPKPALIVGDGPGEERTDERDQRDGQVLEHAPAHLLRRNDVDIGISKHEHERPAEARTDECEHEGKKKQVQHRRLAGFRAAHCRSCVRYRNEVDGALNLAVSQGRA